jgi:hypothetical protein
MKVEVLYDVPVSAVVDTESGEVESVIVWDEAVERRDGEFALVGAEHRHPWHARGGSVAGDRRVGDLARVGGRLISPTKQPRRHSANG